MTILKRIIAPVQARILEKHLCPGCTKNLDKMKLREPVTQETELVHCECGRAYIFIRFQNKYRRALPEELRRLY